MGDQKGELSQTAMIAEPNRKKKDSSSFLERTQPMKSHGLLVHYKPFQVPFPLYKSVLLPLLCRDLHVALHSCRPQIAILCWSWINPSFLEKYLAVYLFYVNTSSTFLSSNSELNKVQQYPSSNLQLRAFIMLIFIVSE